MPPLWWYEVRNTLIVNERRGRLTPADTTTFLRALSRLRLTVDHEPEEQAVLSLARQHRLTVYDASYLELAQRLTLPIAALDKDLGTAARANGVPPPTKA